MYFIDRQRVIYCGVPSSSTLRFYTYKCAIVVRIPGDRREAAPRFVEYSGPAGSIKSELTNAWNSTSVRLEHLISVLSRS